MLPDGTNLPPGSGTAAQGAKLFVDKGCSLCHGDGRQGRTEPDAGRQPVAHRGRHRLEQDHRQFLGLWPTTLFDYIRRAMPWTSPHTLSDDEVYALCAYLFAANNLIPEDEVMNAQTLPKVKMPNHDNFIIKFPDRI